MIEIENAVSDRFEYLIHFFKDLYKYWKSIDSINSKEKNSTSINVDTTNDNKMENYIKDKITNNFKNDIVLSEGNDNSFLDEPTWIVDPIDGSLNYARGIHYYSTSIAFSFNRQVMIGAVLNLCTGKKYYAIQGRGAYYENSKLSVSKTSKLNQSFALSSTANSYGSTDVLLKLIKSSKQVRIMGSTALDICSVASGAVDFRVLANAKLVDYAAAKLILEEAGGVFSCWDGTSIENSSIKLVACNKVLHSEIINLLSN